MINNGAILIRYGHSVFVKRTSQQEPEQKLRLSTTSHLPILAQRLVAELHRSETLLSSDDFVQPIKIKNKYFEADLSCVIVDDNIVEVIDDDEGAEKQNTALPAAALTTSQDFIASLKCGRVPFGIVQIVDLAQHSSHSLLRDDDCGGSSYAAWSSSGEGGGGGGGGGGRSFGAPLFNLCLVVASSSSSASNDELHKINSSNHSNNNSNSNNKNNNNNNNDNDDLINPLSRLQSGQQHLFQKWRESCVDLGVECVPWILSDNGDNAKPQPPPAGVERRGLLQSMKEGELSGSSRVLEVLSQSLWCTIDPLLALKVKERKLNNSREIFEGIYRDNLIGLISSSRFTCEFGKNLFARVPGVSGTTLFLDDKNQNQNSSSDFIFVGSADGQNFSATLSPFNGSLSSASSTLNCYFSPFQMMISPSPYTFSTAASSSLLSSSSFLVANHHHHHRHSLGVSELNKMLLIPSCKLICFHLLMSDLRRMSPSVSSSSSSSSSSTCRGGVDFDESSEMSAKIIAATLDSILHLLSILNKSNNGEFTRRIKAPRHHVPDDELSCAVIIEENDSPSQQKQGHECKKERFHSEMTKNDHIRGILCDLMQVGCEVVFVDSSSSSSLSEDDGEDDGTLWDPEEDGAIGLNRVGEILACVPWKSDAIALLESSRKAKENSPLEKNNVVLMIQLADYNKNNNNNNNRQKVATFISKCFSDDREATLTSAHDKKTEWLTKQMLLLLLAPSKHTKNKNSSSNEQHRSSCQVFSLDLATKYYDANVDVVLTEAAMSKQDHFDAEAVNALIDLTNPQVLLFIVNGECNKPLSVKKLIEALCFVKTDPEGEDHVVVSGGDDEEHDDDNSNQQQDEAAKKHSDSRFPLGPHSDKIAIVVDIAAGDDGGIKSATADVDSSFDFFCQENFIERIFRNNNNSSNDNNNNNNRGGEGSEGDSRSTITQQVFDSLSCVEWKNIVKRAASGGIKNIHDDLDDDDTERSAAKKAVRTHATSTAAAASASTSPLSLIDTAMQNLLGPDESKSKTTNKNTNMCFTCEIPRKTHFFDTILKKTVLRRDDSDSGAPPSRHDDDNDDLGDDNDDDDNDMSDLLQQMREVRDSKRLTREERQNRAEELSKQFAKRLHQNDELADAIVKNLNV